MPVANYPDEDVREVAARHAFHPIQGLFEDQKVQENTRVLVGNGTPYLKAPGLKKLIAVRTDQQEFDRQIVHEYLMDHSAMRIERVVMPTFDLAHGPDGTPVLRRHICSNFGIWQEGEKFYVEGEWDPAVPAPPLPREPQKALKKGLR